MSVVINTNTAATIASNNLSASTAMLQKSLSRLSSGSKIVTAADDAGGVAVASRLSAASKRSGVVSNNIGSAISFLQNQDSGLKTMAKMLERMNELQTLYKDSTKSSTDIGNYETEFGKLKTSLHDMQLAQFNGNSLYDDTADRSITVNGSGGTYSLNDPSALITDSSGWAIGQGAGFANTQGGAVTLDTHGFIAAGQAGNLKLNDTTIAVATRDSLTDIANHINSSTAGVSASVSADNKLTLTSKTLGTSFIIQSTGSTSATLTGLGLSASTISSTTGTDVVGDAITNIAEARAQNGADQSVLGYYSELNSATKINYEAATSRIMDVDVAEESTQLARWNTLVQAGTAMIAQANGSTQSALSLLK